MRRKSSQATSAPQGAAAQRDLLSGLRDPRVLALGLVGFSNGAALFGSQLWLPQIDQGDGLFQSRDRASSSRFPIWRRMAAMIVWGRSSDRRGERIWHIAIPCLVAVTGFLGASVAHSNLLMLVSLTIAIVGVLAYFGPFFSLPSSFLSGPAAAGGIALINSFANFGGFLGPTVIGVIKEQTGSYAVAMVALGAGLTASAVIVLMLGRAMTARQVQIA